MTIRSFPPGFLWGVATAGHQNEGDNVDSDTWFVEHVTPTVFREPSGRACDGYRLWAEDVDLAASLGLSAYRFSVEWARVEPVEGEFSDDALAHYEAIVDRCLERGLAPVVTFNHFTAPHWFAKKGGWLDADAPATFARYCDRVMAAFGDRIAYAVTLNEPNLCWMLRWVPLPDFVRDLERATLVAASEAAGVERYRLANVMVPEEFDAMAEGMEAAHRAARAVIKARRPELPVGFSIAIVDDRVVGDDPTVRDAKREDVYGRWMRLAREDDFVGVQNYEAAWYDAVGAVGPDGGPAGGLHSGVEPTSLAGCVAYTYEQARVPILVTEHGRATADDTERVAFIPPSLDALLDVIESGVPVLGYIHWTFMDNFEWIFGFGDHALGLFGVDRETFERTPKPSSEVYAAIVRAHGVPG